MVIFDQILASRYWSIEITPSEPVEGNVPETIRELTISELQLSSNTQQIKDLKSKLLVLVE